MKSQPAAERSPCSQLPAHTTTFTPPRHLTTSAKVYLFDEGSTISWVPCGKKLTCSFPGIKFAYGPDVYFDKEVSRQPIPSPDSTRSQTRHHAQPDPTPQLKPPANLKVSVLEMDGKFDNLQELIYVESHLSNTATKFYGELTQQMLKVRMLGELCRTPFCSLLLLPLLPRALHKTPGSEVPLERSQSLSHSLAPLPIILKTHARGTHRTAALGRPGLGQRHRLLPDPLRAQDPRDLREDHLQEGRRGPDLGKLGKRGGKRALPLPSHCSRSRAPWPPAAVGAIDHPASRPAAPPLPSLTGPWN